ncbi:preprotein translocase subunit SecE [Candidatus Amesbacteria bacterium RIFOXYB1_FULL_47_13]|nr:MAG: preprotein translocase subunit SecE [Candidatus Amesbacteria bacterium RIFOXYB1_FULL_47_13]HBC72517.1 preprotein translocase subunit SecE [Candidatus Amesbacteria bacterium]
MNPLTYLRETLSELKQVTWPTRQQTIQLTLIVIGISVLVAIYIGSLDFLFTNLLTSIVK